MPADVCVLEFVTRAQGEFDTSVKVLKAGAVLCCGLSATGRATHGSCVTARDLLFNVPVRRRQLLEDPGAEVERTRQRLFRMALGRPDVELTLVSGPLGGSASASAQITLLAFGPGRSVHLTFGAAFGGDAAACMLPLRGSHSVARHGMVSISGLVASPVVSDADGRGARLCLGFPSMEACLLFVNGRSVTSPALTAMLDAMFAAAVAALTALSAAKEPGTTVHQQMTSKRPRRGANTPAHCPCVLFLTLPRSSCDIMHEDAGLVASFRTEGDVLIACSAAVQACWRDAAPCMAHESVVAAMQVALAASTGQVATVPSAPRSCIVHFQCADGPDCCSVRLPLGAWPRRRPPSRTVTGTAVHLEGGTDNKQPVQTSQLERTRMAAHIATASSWEVVPGMVTAAALVGAAAIACIPGTFVLALDTTGALVAIDQHAADERVLLERMHATAHRRSATAVERPRVMLTPGQSAALRAHSPGLRAWGWQWEWATCPPDGGTAADEVRVTRVPLIEGTLLTEKLFGEWLHELAALPAAAAPPGTPCPPSRGVRALLASKACRHAIMFGDALTTEEGQLLVDALARCRQSLSCAHGRPTAAPLVHVDQLARLLDTADGDADREAFLPVDLDRARQLLAEASS